MTHGGLIGIKYNLTMKHKFYLYLFPSLLMVGFINSGIAYAATPTLSLSPSGSDVQISVTGGDPNASVFFYYNIGSPSGQSITTIGATNSSGSFSGKITPSLYGMESGSIYVIVNGQQSATQTWSSATVIATVPATVTNTPAPAIITPIPSSNRGDLLSTIQNMQAQLAQILSQIQIMATKLNQLASAITPTTSRYQFLNPLVIGDNGNDVTELQKKLKAEGIYSGPINGNFGSLTREAVKKYQTLHGLTPLGNIGPATRAALNS